MNQSNQSNLFNVSRETLRTPSSYKVEAVKRLVATCKVSLAAALAANVTYNWASDVECFLATGGAFENQVSRLQLNDATVELYFMPSVIPSQGIGLHMLIVKNEEPTHVLFIGFYEFSVISQIVAGIGQMKLVRGDECRESKTRNWVMSNVDKLSHRIVTCLFGSDLEDLYSLI